MLQSWEAIIETFHVNPEQTSLKTLVCSGQVLPEPPPQYAITVLDAAHGLPDLRYPAQSFHLAICSDFLFTFSDLLSEDFHVKSLLSFCRVATEVQVFPLIDRFGQPSIHLGLVLQRLQDEGIGAEIKSIEDPAHGTSNALLRLWTETCHVSKEIPEKVSRPETTQQNR